MTQDPAILAPILAVVTFAVVMVLAYLAGRGYFNDLKRLYYLTRCSRLPEPETYGDDGGHPKPLYAMTPCKPDTPAPEIEYGLLAGGKPTPMTHMEAENQ